VLLNFLN